VESIGVSCMKFSFVAMLLLFVSSTGWTLDLTCSHNKNVCVLHTGAGKFYNVTGEKCPFEGTYHCGVDPTCSGNDFTNLSVGKIDRKLMAVFSFDGSNRKQIFSCKRSN
jgi:hypothetical protein